MKRKAVSTKTRFEVFKRDGFMCQYCGATPPRVVLHCDHIVAASKGGPRDMDNLITSCSECNMGKGARDLTAIPQSLKDKSEETAEREAQVIGYYKIMEKKRRRIERECWQVIACLEGKPQESYDKRAFGSIRKFLTLLPLPSVLEAADIANMKYSGFRAFRYFCGICWRRINPVDNQE